MNLYVRGGLYAVVIMAGGVAVALGIITGDVADQIGLIAMGVLGIGGSSTALKNLRPATTQVAGERAGNVPHAWAQELHHGRRRAPYPLLRHGDQAQGRMGDSVSAISSIVFRSLSSRLDIVSAMSHDEW